MDQSASVCSRLSSIEAQSRAASKSTAATAPCDSRLASCSSETPTSTRLQKLPLCGLRPCDSPGWSDCPLPGAPRDSHSRARSGHLQMAASQYSKNPIERTRIMRRRWRHESWLLSTCAAWTLSTQHGAGVIVLLGEQTVAILWFVEHQPKRIRNGQASGGTGEHHEQSLHFMSTESQRRDV